MALTACKRKWGVKVPGKPQPYLVWAHSPQEAREHIARVVGVPMKGILVRPIPTRSSALSKRVEIMPTRASLTTEERRHFAAQSGDRAFRLLK